MKTSIASLFIILFVTCAVHAQDSLSSETNHLIDTALAKMAMTRSDLWLPWDATGEDNHRLEIVKDFFAHPLHTFDITKRYASAIHDSLPAFFHTLLPTLKLGFYNQEYFKNALAAKELDHALGIGLDTITGLVETAVLRQYLAGLVLATNSVRRARSAVDSTDYAFLARQSDSLLLLSEESQNASVYELHEEEAHGNQLSKVYFNTAAATSFEGIYQQGFSLYEYYRELLKLSNTLRSLYTDNIKTIILKTKYGKIAIGGKGNDVYNDDFIFIFDAGGNDIYNLPRLSKEEALNRPVRCIVDLGGDDTYTSGSYALASGVFGVGLLFDLAGNDTYIAGNFSLGSGLYGVGILEDFAGHDTYTGGVCTEGSGVFGVGMLIDHTGNDLYRCQAQAQGFGFTRGFGALVEYEGNDSYVTMSPFQDFLRYDAHYIAFTQGAALGQRPIASGGLGMLFDYNGSDSYQTDIFGQGTGYWYGLGALYDAAGDDHYQAFQYSQGAGVHLAQGILYDKSGNDLYTSHGVSQGCGHDIGFGSLIDEDGDDGYTAESLSLGAGNANGLSLFVDKSGNDTYIARNASNTMGFADFRRDYGTIGVFVDGGGKDLYGDTLKNNSFSTKSTYGIAVDLDIVPLPVVDNSVPALTPPDSLRSPLAGSIDSLFIQAGAAPQKFQYNVQPARDKIIAMGRAAFPFLGDKLGTEFPRERLSLENILPKMYEQDTIGMSQFILDSLGSGEERTFAISAFVAGQKAIRQTVPSFVQRLYHPNWRIRALSAQQLGKIGDSSVADTLAHLLDDPHPHVQMRAAYSLGQLMPSRLPGLMPKILAHDNQLVRNNFIQGILSRKDSLSVEFISNAIAGAPNAYGKLALTRLLPSMRMGKTSVQSFRDFIFTQPVEVREAAYRSLQTANSKWLKAIAQYRASEPDASLRALLPDLPKEPAKQDTKEKEKRKGKNKEKHHKA